MRNGSADSCDNLFVTFRVSRRRREMYCGHARLCVYVCLSVRGRMPCPDSRPTRMQNFTPLVFSAAEKSVTVQRNEQRNKQTKKKITHNILSIPHTTVWWDNKN